MLAFVLASSLISAGRFGHDAQALLARPAFAHSTAGIAIYDLDAQRMLWQQNAERFFLAASTTKLFTEGTALRFLGPDYRWGTNVYRTGAIDRQGTLHGSVVLRASGDPNLSGRITSRGTLTYENQDHSYDGGPDTRAVDGDPLAVLRDFARQIRGRGVRRITGGAVVDDSLFPGGFAERGTGAVVSPIVVNDNIIDVTVTPARPGEPVQVAVRPQTSYARFVVRAQTGANGTENTIRLISPQGVNAPNRTVVVEGTMPADSPTILYAYDVPSPRVFAQQALRDVLEQEGVQVTGRNAPGAEPHAFTGSYRPRNVVASHVSPPLREDVKVTLKVSDNLHADAMPYLWGQGSLDRAFALEREFLQAAGLGSSGIVQSDGLGGDAYIQPAYMVGYLHFVSTQPYFSAFYDALPVMGVDGTLYDVEMSSPAAGHVRAKTGTWSVPDLLNGRAIVTAKGLAGYVTTQSGRHLAFCFYLNNLESSGDADAEANALLGRLATLAYLDF